jgi:5-hydroxyisourate hydrolase
MGRRKTHSPSALTHGTAHGALGAAIAINAENAQRRRHANENEGAMNTQAGGISIHAVDVAVGRIAQGLTVRLHRLDPDPGLIGEGTIGANGLLDHPCAGGNNVITGVYEVEFDIADYLAAQGRDAPFLDIVRFRFVMRDASEHHHLPFKFTPFGYSLFKGA